MKHRNERERRGWPRPRALLALALLAGCVTVADRVAQVEARLIGVKARDLNRCVGVPFNVDEDGETEFLTYRWFDEEESDPFDPPPYTQPRLPGVPTERAGRTLEDPPPKGVAYCQLVFEVRGGLVRSVDVEARRANGLNDDAECISKAEVCAPRKG